MKTTLAITIVAVGACGTTTPPVEAPAISSAQSDQMPDVGPVARACLTRYTFTEIDVSFDCPTTLVGGDPHHYVTTCRPPATSHPAFFPPPDTDEIELDDGGRVVHEVKTYAVPPNGWVAVEDTVHAYTADGQIQETTARDGNGTELHHRQVDSRDASGRPLTVSLRQIPLEIGGVSFPETGSMHGLLGYDDNGRLVDEAFRYTSTDHLYLERSVTYDDAELRRDYTMFADFVGVLPGFDQPSTTPGYEQLDAAGHTLETAHFSDPPSIFDYTYDAQGRVLTSVWTDRWRSLGQIIRYVYDCP
jgi:YD repeat-containing protein